MLPVGLGAREAIYVFMLAKFGVALGTGMAAAVVYRGVIYILFGIMAMVSVVLLDRGEPGIYRTLKKIFSL